MDAPERHDPSPVTPLDTELVDHAVRMATLAPSVHNTQPWRFVRQGAALELYADRRRQLSVLDPTGRLMITSCGAVLHHLHVALRAAGLTGTTVLLPDPADADLLARTTVEAGPAAADDEVADAVAELHRATVRARFDEGPLPEGLLEDLRLRVECEGATLRLVRAEEVVEVQVLVSRAEHYLESDADYRRELAAWVQTEGLPRADGIRREALDLGAQRGELVEGRVFALDEEQAAQAEPPAAEHPTLVVLLTDDDTPRSWLYVGEALSRLLLTCTERGVVAQPIGQVTDLPSTRAALASALGVLGRPQLLLRLGRAHGAVHTARRDLSDVLEVLPAPSSG